MRAAENAKRATPNAMASQLRVRLPVVAATGMTATPSKTRLSMVRARRCR